MQAFTLKSSMGLLRRLNTNICVSSNYRDQTFEYDNDTEWCAVWDTGATQTCISKKLCEDMKLIPIGQAETGTAGGLISVNVYAINIVLPNGLNIVNLAVMGVDLASSGCDVLIGMDVITLGDFCLTNFNEQTLLSFVTPSLYHIDYVRHLDSQEVSVAEVAIATE